MYYHSDNVCASCGAHWMQLCSCTQEEVCAAENERLEQLRDFDKIESTPFKDLVKKLKEIRNE